MTHAGPCMLLVASTALAGCLTEDDWDAYAPAAGAACASEKNACAENKVLRCSAGLWKVDATCKSWETCLDGACVCPGGNCCGNGQCEASRSEDCKSCPQDCGSCCTSGETKCVGTSLSICTDGKWPTAVSCTSVCKAAGYSKVQGCSLWDGKYACICSHDGKIGDPCSKSSDCAQGTCNGLWCGKICQTFQDCGTNSLGYTNWCIATKTGRICYPSCYGAKCEDRFAGTTCQNVTTEGVTVGVCR